jgi:DNA-binding LytR/AlgR family response regulator
MRCMIVDDEEMSSGLLKHLVQQVPDLQLVGTCKTGQEALEQLKSETVDLLFLDIEMPDMTGLDLIRNLPHPPLVILTTGHKQYALEAFENNAVDYLIKPIDAAKFTRAVDKAHALFRQIDKEGGTFTRDYLFIKKNTLMNKVQVKDILWIEALGDYVTIHTVQTSYTLHMTLKSLGKRLPADRFHRIHRSYIIQLEHISCIDDNVIKIGDKLIPVGSIYKEEFMQRLNFLA